MKKELIEGEDYYISLQGFRIFTEKYLLNRGYCCVSGCKHCPYGYDKKTDTFVKVKKNEQSAMNNKQ